MNQAQLDLLVISAKSGNAKTFSLLCEYIYPHLLRFALKSCSDEDIASDAVQDVLMKLPSTLRSLTDPRAFKAWVFKGVKWRIIDLIRQGAKHDKHRISEFDITTVAQSPASDTDTQLLLSLIDQLQTIDRETVYLFYLEELTLAEISLVLNTPIGTLKSRLNRARMQLKDKLNAIENPKDTTPKVVKMRGV